MNFPFREVYSTLADSFVSDSFNVNDDIHMKVVSKIIHETFMIFRFLMYSRKSVYVTSGAGSQSSEYELMKKFYSKMSDICDQNIKQIEEEW
jgi:hypothetical protein